MSQIKKKAGRARTQTQTTWIHKLSSEILHWLVCPPCLLWNLHKIQKTKRQARKNRSNYHEDKTMRGPSQKICFVEPINTCGCLGRRWFWRIQLEWIQIEMKQVLPLAWAMWCGLQKGRKTGPILMTVIGERGHGPVSKLGRSRLKQCTPSLWECTGFTVTQPDESYAVLTGLY